VSERLKYLGRLKERELEAERLMLRMEGLIKTMRDLLDPTVSPDELNLAEADIWMDELVKCQAELLSLGGEISKIKRALNG